MEQVVLDTGPRLDVEAAEAGHVRQEVTWNTRLGSRRIRRRGKLKYVIEVSDLS